ncbi:hypothetical protein EVAR_64419_1 [Eumeta japonica]|uniref:Uncharacterized protein n=1 Tax=Eumeta variegata TaxID=151549 RepID=A0A4C1ZUR9_EUMVA|nr:hypothetical protein EVAR_64419_1 [Eumeta japonica]
MANRTSALQYTLLLEYMEKYGLTGKQNKKKQQQVLGQRYHLQVTLAVPVEEIAVDNAITSSEAEIVCTESEIISRDPEIISTPLNVEISAEQSYFVTRPNTEDEEDAEPPRTAGRASTHRVDRRRRRRPTPFQMASVQFAEIEQRRLDLEERRLEVDRLEKRISLKIATQEKFYTGTVS